MINIGSAIKPKKYLAPLTILAGLIISMPTEAKQLKYQRDDMEIWARISLSIQGALLDSQIKPSEEGRWHSDASIRFNAQRVSANALTYGLRIEYDSNTHAAEDLQRDEVYAYLTGDFGRLELGEQDGPADRLAFHAPIIGLGQIRGDFSRYVGRQALLSAYDTSDSAKLIYLSPPTQGWRFGISYAPNHTRNLDAERARDQTQQNDAIELGVQYQQTLGNWIGGLSGGYVTADAEPITERADMNSWSIGGELRRGRLTLGSAYVWRGDSNMRTENYDQAERNVGAYWRGKKWSAALSTSQTTSSSRDYDVTGIGMTMKLKNNFNLKSDLIKYSEITSSGSRNATILITELEYRY